jgi:hypothetical protein
MHEPCALRVEKLSYFLARDPPVVVIPRAVAGVVVHAPTFAGLWILFGDIFERNPLG